MRYVDKFGSLFVEAVELYEGGGELVYFLLRQAEQHHIVDIVSQLVEHEILFTFNTDTTHPLDDSVSLPFTVLFRLFIYALYKGAIPKLSLYPQFVILYVVLQVHLC